MKCKKWMAAALTAICLTGCAAPQAETEPTQAALWEAGTVTELSQTITAEGCTLILNGSVELPSPEELYHVELSLDEDALDTALSTLASLQQRGKLIGIISHVQGLKERVPTQIEVLPIGGGRSRILGPGCRCKTDLDN